MHIENVVGSPSLLGTSWWYMIVKSFQKPRDEDAPPPQAEAEASTHQASSHVGACRYYALLSVKRQVRMAQRWHIAAVLINMYYFAGQDISWRGTSNLANVQVNLTAIIWVVRFGVSSIVMDNAATTWCSVRPMRLECIFVPHELKRGYKTFRGACPGRNHQEQKLDSLRRRPQQMET